jgi:hypothetical protein
LSDITSTSKSTPNKKRKAETMSAGEDDEDKVVNLRTDITREATTTLHLKDVDHAPFALFLKFIYTGAYPPTIDIHPATCPSLRTFSPHSPPQSVMAYMQNPVIPASVHGTSFHLPIFQSPPRARKF